MEKIAVKIIYQKTSATHTLRKGLNLQVLEKEVPQLEFDCRKADCGICIFKIKSGEENLSPKTPAEADFLRAMRADPDERLACQCRVFGPIELEIEERGA